MGLDGSVRCRCIQDGLAKPHPFAERLALDHWVAAVLTGDPTLDDWLVHERLGNIWAIAHVRERLGSLEGEPTPRFPILLGKVVYNGLHSGDLLSSDVSAELLKEMEEANRFPNHWDACDSEFFWNLRRLCEASIATRNPIVF